MKPNASPLPTLATLPILLTLALLSPPAAPADNALGDGHATLATLAGAFELTASFWPDPTAPPEVSELPARRQLILGGRALSLEVGPDAGGFRGSGLMGFDNQAGSFWYVWTDTSTTGLSSLTGTLDAGGAGTLEGVTPTPFGPAALRVEIRFEGSEEIHDHYVPGPDGEVRLLELRYRRAGTAGEAGLGQPPSERGLSRPAASAASARAPRSRRS